MDYVVNGVIALFGHLFGSSNLILNLEAGSSGGFEPVVTIDNIPLPIMLNYQNRLEDPTVLPHFCCNIINPTR